ncbi:MAG: tyrosine-type recombinase/integrase [Oscillospiraceae bacterium]|nr:tyrosine-type recombinase/integrase [Oscillospiraceae bacterium]
MRLLSDLQHMFRHSFAALFLEEDIDIRYIQKILGHSSITATQIYTHVAMANQKKDLSIKYLSSKTVYNCTEFRYNYL